MVSLSLAIPAYNEEESLEDTVNAYLAAFRKIDGDFEIVLLDDGSHDRTRRIIERLHAEHPQIIRPVFHTANRGIAVACETAQKAATKEYVLTLGADGQYPSEIIGACLSCLQSRPLDILICKRRQKHYSFYRALVSRFYRGISRVFFGIDLFDPGGAKVIRRRLFDEIPTRSRSVFRDPERVIRAAQQGCRIGMIEVACVPRQAGKAHGGSIPLILSAFRDVCLLWCERHFKRRVPQKILCL